MSSYAGRPRLLAICSPSAFHLGRAAATSAAVSPHVASRGEAQIYSASQKITVTTTVAWLKKLRRCTVGKFGMSADLGAPDHRRREGQLCDQPAFGPRN